ncbi:hypothetical protein D3C85_1026540 [compost metagenome]
MRNDVVEYRRDYHFAFRLAPNAQRKAFKELCPELPPSVVIPDVITTFPFTPCIRVQHLHSLRAYLTRSGGLHGDPGLSHGSSTRSA